MKDILKQAMEQRLTALQQEFRETQNHFLAISGAIDEVNNMLTLLNSMTEPEKEVVADEHNAEGA